MRTTATSSTAMQGTCSAAAVASSVITSSSRKFGGAVHRDGFVYWNSFERVDPSAEAGQLGRGAAVRSWTLDIPLRRFGQVCKGHAEAGVDDAGCQYREGCNDLGLCS